MEQAERKFYFMLIVLSSYYVIEAANSPFVGLEVNY